MGGDVEEVLKDVGLAEGEDDAAETGRGRKDREEAKVFLHCTVGPKEGEAERRAEEDEVSFKSVEACSEGRRILS